MKTLPNSGERVIFFWLASNGHKRTSIGFYAEKNTVSANHWENIEHAYFCEEEDAYFCYQGWHEEMWSDEYYYLIDGQVVGWQELPKFPDLK